MNATNSAKPTKAILYLLRHGATEGGTEKRFIGQTDILLSDIGRRQAQWWQEELSSIKFDAIYCSDLSRAIETAQIVANKQRAGIQIKPNLREINLGDWDGIAMQEIREKYPDSWRKRGEQMDRYRPPNGENLQDLQDRVLTMVESIDFNQIQKALIVSHAGVNRVLLCHILNKSLKDVFQIPQGEAALNVIRFVDGNGIVKAMNKLPE
jgi:probable phosphoglycerate mutase